MRRRDVAAKNRNARALRGSLGVWLLSCAVMATALEPSTPLANFGRQAWVMENGLPQNTVQTLLQTRDGYVWLGTEVGLVRFDGSGFAVFDRNSSPALPGNDIRCLLETADGALWIGTREGLARWKDGAVTKFVGGEGSGLPGNSIRKLVGTTNGGLWAWTERGLARMEGERFVAVTVKDGLPEGEITALTADSHGTLWVGTTVGAAFYGDGRWTEVRPSASVPGAAGRAGGAGPFQVTAGGAGGVLVADTEGIFLWAGGKWAQIAPASALPKDGIDFLLRIPGGALALASKTSLVVVQGGSAVQRLAAGRELPGTRIQSMFSDHEGSLWIGTNSGLARLAAGKVQLLPVTDPLASASVLTLTEDHEGDVWAGTESGGLHILRDQRFRTMGAHEGLSSDATTAVVEDGAGTLWVGTNGAGLNAMRLNTGLAAGGAIANAVRNYSVRNGLTSDVILSLAAAPNGDLWVGTPDGLNRLSGGAITSFTSADGLPDDFIRSLLVDADGSLWVGTRRGLTHWAIGKSIAAGAGISPAAMETFTQANGLGSDLVGAMTRDANGDLWVATLAGLSRVHDGKIVNFTTANGLSSNVVTALLARKDGTLLIGTQDRGWDEWDGKGFSAAKGNGLEQTTIHAILDDGAGHLWFATGSGIARCDCMQGNGMKQGAGCSNWIEFGAADGLRSRETAINSHPSAWRAQDGHLWFATPKGLVDVDPAHFPVNTIAPPVMLERFAVDDVSEALHAADAMVKIPAGHVHFEFDYAGLSFVAPQKVRYRYMLQGFDHDWTNAGTRRTAYYTNIPPGSYTFKVQAANNDGLWNTVGAAQAFELKPHFYQTVWFYALLVAAMVGLVVLVLRLRLQRAESEFRAVLGERSRIAREVHDTLAQGYVGISVQLEVLTELLRQNKAEAAEHQLNFTRGYVREGLDDARQSIWALRSQDSGETTLPVLLRRMVDQSGSSGAGFEPHFSMFGAYRPLPPGTEREILRVAQEAIQNAKRHAQAKNLYVQLEYGPAVVALEVRDDGRGFSVGKTEESPVGHYGLIGMKERAATIGGKLEVSSEPGAGTTVRLRAAAPKAARTN